MPAMNDKEILVHLKSRRKYCVALLELSRKQRELISGRKYTELLTLIGKKQRVLGCLEGLKQKQPNVVSEWKSRRDELPAEIRTVCETVIQETELLLTELLNEEQICTDDLKRSRDETSRELSELTSGQRAHQAYGTTSSLTRNRYLDIRL